MQESTNLNVHHPGQDAMTSNASILGPPGNFGPPIDDGINFRGPASVTVTNPEITNPQVVAQCNFGQVLHVPTSNVRGINAHFAPGPGHRVGDLG